MSTKNVLFLNFFVWLENGKQEQSGDEIKISTIMVDPYNILKPQKTSIAIKPYSNLKNARMFYLSKKVVKE